MLTTTFNSLQEAVDSKICFFCKEKMYLMFDYDVKIINGSIFHKNHTFPLSTLFKDNEFNNTDKVHTCVLWLECLKHNYKSDITINFTYDFNHFFIETVEDQVMFETETHRYEILQFHDLNYTVIDLFKVNFDNETSKKYFNFINRTKLPIFIFPSTTEELFLKIKTYLTFS